MTKSKTTTAYKAFDGEMRCRDFQFEVGKTYTHEGDIAICESGFHACLNPLDCLRYYPLIGSRFAIIEYDGASLDHQEDSKICGASITIKAEVRFGDLIGRAVDYIMAKAAATSGDNSPAATSGYNSPAATSGDNSPAATSGDNSPAEASGANSSVAAIGRGATARAGESGGIALAEYDGDGNLIAMFASLVGQNGIKPDTWYRLKNGKPEEVK